MDRTVKIVSFGCKVSQYEGQALLENFSASGWQPVPKSRRAGLVVVNTCVVTARAAAEGIRAARRAGAEGSRVIVTGCLARQADSGAAPGRAMLPGTKIKTWEQLLAGWPTGPGEQITFFAGHSRAFLKVQDGCDRRCAYCLVSRIRGPARDKAPDRVLSEIRALAESGYRAVVLSGINLGLYGRGNGGLEQLLEKIFRDPGLPVSLGVALSSLEPDLLSEPLLDLMAGEPRLAPRLHLPLQSGSDAVLAAMGRGYRAAEYLEITRRARGRVPGLTLSTDLMVGFPGETERDFGATLALAQRIRFDRVHVFRFSPRPGTPAATMDRQVPEKVKKERARTLRENAGVSGAGGAAGKTGLKTGHEE